ncbi:hypothetical protein RclHR1_00150064 [Rhizophagus clarus]|uniref:Uncharacterized protein n=1 Tax=Rhizophagus clarus TaxID=94130 RepID=A0A2Z6R6W0_9GLOM|nr:hypothetical protein RclHR1_00150064 [Rhizophagus clarus]
MTPGNLLTREEDRRPLIIKEDIDFESNSNSSVENLNLMEQPNANPFSSFDEVFYHGNNNNNNNNCKQSTSRNNKKPKYYQSVGELLWQNGQIYSDVRLTFEDRGILASCAGIPSELRLHSLVLYQSQFFKDQLSVTSAAVPTSPNSNIIREKQIIVRLPSHVTEEDMVNFYSTLKLMYTKNWDNELANNLTKGVGCLSVCCEIGFYEGIEACWKWLVKKCNRDNNKEMMKRLIEAYPNLHEKFTEPEEKLISNSNPNPNPNSFSYLGIPLQKSSSKSKRTPPLSRRTSRRSQRSRRRTNSNGSGSFSKQKFHRTETSISSDSSASPLLRYENDINHPPSLSLPSPPHSNSENSPITPNFPSLPSISPPSIFSNSRILNNWITNFESYAISSKRACSKMLPNTRKDSKCFPFLEHFVSVFESINQLGRARRITSPDALDYTLRMLNVIKIEHAHFHTLHINKLKSPISPSSPSSPSSNIIKSRPTSPLTPPSPSSPLPSLPPLPSTPPLLPNSNNNPPIVLHESLDEPLSQIIKNVLAPIEQKHLCDYLWAPSNISNLMHLREIRSDDDDDMEEDEFDGYDQVMGEESLVKASRVSKVEHMIVGEKMAKLIREIRSNASRK